MRARKVLRWWHRAAAPSGWRVCRWRWPAPAQCASHGSRRTPKPGRTGTLSPRRRCTPGPARKWRDTALRPMLQQVVGDRVAGSGQLVLSLMQQFPKICTHGQAPSSGPQCPHHSLYLLLPLPLHREGGIFIKSIKEVWPLDKCAFRHNSEEKAVQSI